MCSTLGSIGLDNLWFNYHSKLLLIAGFIRSDWGNLDLGVAVDSTLCNLMVVTFFLILNILQALLHKLLEQNTGAKEMNWF